MDKSPSSVKESRIEYLLKRAVEARGGLCIKLVSPSARGIFDRLVVLPGGRVIFVELKRPKGGRLSPHQMKWRDEFALLGAAVACVRNLEDIKLLLSPP